MESRDIFHAVAERSALSREEAADLTRATLTALGQRLSAGEMRHLVSQLPEDLTAELGEGGQERFDHDEFIRRVSEHTGLTTEETTAGVRAVFAELGQTDKFEQVLDLLPAGFRG